MVIGQWECGEGGSGDGEGDGEMVRRMRDYSWAGSALGDPRDWPSSLRTACRICLTSRFPMIVWWGPELRFLYNDAYMPLLGDKHTALGRPGRQVWSEIWDTIGPMLDISQIVEDPHVRARDVLVRLPDDEMGEMPMHHHVPRLAGSPGVFVRPAPRLGEHNAEILRRVGIEEAALEQLVAQGVVHPPRGAMPAAQGGSRDEA